MKKNIIITLSFSLLFNNVFSNSDSNSNTEIVENSTSSCAANSISGNNQNNDNQIKEIDPLENFFPIDSWQKYYKTLNLDEKKEIKELCGTLNNFFIQICSDSTKLSEPYQAIIEKYRKYKNIDKCNMQICYTLVKQEDAINALACKELGDLASDFCKTISSEEEANLQEFLTKLKDFWKKSILQIQPLLENKSIAKSKLLEYFKQNEMSLILTIACDHPIAISECLRLLN